MESQINENIDSNNFAVVDARSLKRFNGEIDEPRKGLRRGSIKNSLCLPYGECINQCGSGVTASVLAYAYKIVNKDYQPIIYDGSWSEYGKYSP